nr:type VII secretion integral membrane protein EccD [Corynebacterium lactis]
MQGELLRVRIDALHTPTDEPLPRVDIALPTSVETAALIPDILDVFGIDIADYPLAQWQLRTGTGSVVPAESTLRESAIAPGALLLLTNDPGPIPAPRLFDVADQMADALAGIGIVDGFIGRAVAMLGTVAVALSMLILSGTDHALAAAVCFVAAGGVAAGLRLAVDKKASPKTVTTLLAQIAVLAVACAICFVGVPPWQLHSRWEPAAATAVTLEVIGIALLVATPLQNYARAMKTVGASASATGLVASAYAAGIAGLGQEVPAAGITAAASLIGLLVAPAVAVSAAGIRVPRIPAAGEPFEIDDRVAAPETAPENAGWLFDGFAGTSAIALAAATAGALLGAGPEWTWPMALAAASVVFLAVHSRGHARSFPAGATAVSSAAIAVSIAVHQFGQGHWYVSVALIAPMLAGTALTALDASRVSPTARRAAEFVEAIAIAAILPAAAIIAGVPELVAGAFQ